MKAILLFTLMIFSPAAAQGAAKCIFGASLEELRKNSRLEIKNDLFRTFKSSRIRSMQGELLYVSISLIRDRFSGRSYHLNETFMDRYDGGNTIGWIEEITDVEKERAAGIIVAEISDSEIQFCSAKYQ